MSHKTNNKDIDEIGVTKGTDNNNKILIIYIARFRANNINNINNINSIFYYLLPLDCLRED